MNFNKIDNFNQKDVISNLYKNGIVKVENIFDQGILNEIKLAKDRIFSLFPYGQNNNNEKIIDLDEATKIGYYPIKNSLELEPIFKKILENKYINYMAEEILGKNFFFTDVNMRIIPKTKKILETHRDFNGGLSFSLLLDNISINQGETFFYRDSYKNPPPDFVDLNNFSSNIISTTGKVGDVFFWFPDSWHGRNYNLSDKQTCIFMVDIENENTHKKNIYLYKNFLNKKTNLLNSILKYTGNAPNSLFKNFFYCLLRFKIFRKKIDNEKYAYTRLVTENNFSKNFSFIKYFKMIDVIKTIKIIASKTFQLIIGKNLSMKLKTLIK